MERVMLQAGLAVAELRGELERLGAVNSGREFLMRILSLRSALRESTRRRCRTLATQFGLAGQWGVSALVESWGVEDELHERHAASELWELDATPLTLPLDGELWNAYFDATAVVRPCLTLAAAVVWETLSGAALRFGRHGAERRYAPTPRIDEDLHNAEMLAAMRDEAWDDEDLAELTEGATIGRTMGLRLTRWALESAEAERGAEGWRRSRYGTRLA